MTGGHESLVTSHGKGKGQSKQQGQKRKMTSLKVIFKFGVIRDEIEPSIQEFLIYLIHKIEIIMLDDEYVESFHKPTSPQRL